MTVKTTVNSDEWTVPCGKLKGKRLSELSLAKLNGLNGAYIASKKKVAVEIVEACQKEMKKRKKQKQYGRPQPGKAVQVKQKRRKKSEKWDGVLEARRQMDAELAQINAKRGQVLWVGPWVGGSEDWSERIPGRAEQG